MKHTQAINATALTEDAGHSRIYHYFGSAKTMALIGKAFAEATLKMEKQQ